MILVADGLFFGLDGQWEALLERIPPSRHLEKGVANDRLEMRKIRDVEDLSATAFVVGSSRANAGFRAAHVPPELQRAMVLGRIAHGGIRPFEASSLLDELRPLAPDAVVLVLSEFDVDGPLQVVPYASAGSLIAIRDLLATAGWEFAIGHREEIFRLVAAALLRAYRFREVLHYAFANELRRFPLDEERLYQPRLPPARWNLLHGSGALDLDARQRQDFMKRARAALPEASAGSLRSGFQQIHEITRGAQGPAQRELLRRAVHRLDRRGIAVVVAEAPVHPMAAELYDTTIRDDFLAFARELEKTSGATLVTLEDSGPYDADDFADLTHLNAYRGAPKLTEAISRALAQRLHLTVPAADSRVP